MSVTTIRPTLRMGELIETYAVTARAVRFYEERGLITPGRDRLNRRIFDAPARERLSLIRLFRSVGLGMPEIADLLASQAEPGWDRRVALELERRRDDVARQLAEVEAALEALGIASPSASESRT